MTISQTLLELKKHHRRVLMFLAVSELKPGQPTDFAEFARDFRNWRQKPTGDRLLEYCLRRLAEEKIIAYSSTNAEQKGATFAMTDDGIRIAQEAYLLAEQGTPGFAELLPEKVDLPAAEVRSTRDLTRLYTALTNPSALCTRPHLG